MHWLQLLKVYVKTMKIKYIRLLTKSTVCIKKSQQVMRYKHQYFWYPRHLALHPFAFDVEFLRLSYIITVSEIFPEIKTKIYGYSMHLNSSADFTEYMPLRIDNAIFIRLCSEGLGLIQYRIKLSIVRLYIVSKACDWVLKCSYCFEIWQAVEAPAKFKSDWKTLTNDLEHSRLFEILR